MRRPLIVLMSVLILTLNMCGCASHKPIYQEEVTTPVVVDPAKSYVYFYRPCIVKSTSKTVTILDKLTTVGTFYCGTYMVYETEPGKHVFHANDWLGQDHTSKIELAAGEKTFVEIDMRLSVMDSLSPLTPMDDISENDLKELKRVK